MRKVICPLIAGGLCAYGMLVADVNHTYLATHPSSSGTLDTERVNEIFEEMEQQALTEMEAQGFSGDQITLTRSADAKYPYQINEIMVRVPSGRLDESAVQELAGTFHDEHKRLYTYSVPDMAVDLNAWRVTATGRLPDLPSPAQAARVNGNVPTPRDRRDAYFREAQGRVETPVFDGETLPVGAALDGPAIIELPTTTIVVAPQHALAVDDAGSLTIALS